MPIVDLADVRSALMDLIVRLRHAGIPISDRRAVNFKLVAADSLVCGRAKAIVSDLWVFRHIWNAIEQQEVIAAIVDETLKKIAAGQ